MEYGLGCLDDVHIQNMVELLLLLQITMQSQACGYNSTVTGLAHFPQTILSQSSLFYLL